MAKIATILNSTNKVANVSEGDVLPFLRDAVEPAVLVENPTEEQVAEYEVALANYEMALSVNETMTGHTYVFSDTARIGDRWDGEHIVPAPDPEIIPTWEEIRQKRDGLLRSSDYTQLADAPLNTVEKAAWADYRNELRNITEDFEAPEAVQWPETP